jgi:hypothetical protein
MGRLLFAAFPVPLRSDERVCSRRTELAKARWLDETGQGDFPVNYKCTGHAEGGCQYVEGINTGNVVRGYLVLISFYWWLKNCFEFTRWPANFRINAEHSEGTKDSVSYVSSYI